MQTDSIKLENLLTDIRQCRLCEAELPEGPRPVLQASEQARLLIVGQAPGRRVHESGIPFDDPSGDRLRTWLGVDKDLFYNPAKLAIIPMAFCYPGTGKSGDLPPPARCAESWRQALMDRLPQVELTIVLGRYAMDWHLPQSKKKTLTEVVKDWRSLWEEGVIPLPHPSPRNRRWLSQNPWLEAELVPKIQDRVRSLVAES